MILLLPFFVLFYTQNSSTPSVLMLRLLRRGVSGCDPPVSPSWTVVQHGQRARGRTSSPVRKVRLIQSACEH